MPPNSTIGHYRIVSKIGEGGMGEVWRATDTKLGRDVAVKMLPAALANDSDYLARFLREAKVLASLNHPNIAAIYGIEDSAIIMELVAGATLEERIATGPLPAEEALGIARQIAEGVEAAHDRGVIHRDLKPANIKITPDGVVKVLDFGLAKAAEAVSGALPADSPTLTIRATQAGVIMGTAAYMAPEQAAGKPVDKRADIWSFGAVLWEMITGAKLFDGETVSHILADVLRAPIEFEKLPAATPEPVVRLLRRCLDRDLKTRLRDIGEARIAIGAYLANPAGEIPAVPVPAAGPGRRGVAILAVAALAIAAGIFGWMSRRPVSTSADVYHFALDIDDTRSGNTELSPNGHLVLGNEMGGTGISVRSVDNIAWRRLPETEGARQPFWSSDSTAIGFFSRDRLRIVPVNGGSPRTVAEAPDFQGGSWRGDATSGMILFAVAGILRTVDLGSGKIADVALRFGPGEKPALPKFLPMGSGFVYLVEAGGITKLYRSKLGSTAGPGEWLLDTRRGGVFAPHPRTGEWHMMYVDPEQEIGGGAGGAVFVRTIDPETGTFQGQPIRLLDGVVRRIGTLSPGFSAGANGAFSWRYTSSSVRAWRLRWHDRSGQVVGSVGELGQYVSLALSPDETKVAVLEGYPVQHTSIYNLATGEGSRLSTVPGNVGNTVWSPDSQFVYYTASTETSHRVFRQRPLRGSEPEVLYESGDSRDLTLQDITPDGKTLLLVLRCHGSPGCGIARLDIASGASGKVEVILPDRAEGGGVRISPDGRSLVFSDVRSFYSVRYPPAGDTPKPITTTAFGVHSLFSRDGKTLYLFTGEGFASHPVFPLPEGGIRLGERSILFPIISGTRAAANVGAASRDGKRFLILTQEPTSQLKTQFLSDWTTLIKP